MLTLLLNKTLHAGVPDPFLAVGTRLFKHCVYCTSTEIEL